MRAEISKAVQKLYARWGFWSTSQRPALSESRYPIFLIGLPSWAATPFMRSPGRQRRAPRLIHGEARVGCHGGCANVADVAIQVAQHGSGMPVPDWARLLRCTECGERDADFVVSGARR